MSDSGRVPRRDHNGLHAELLLSMRFPSSLRFFVSQPVPEKITHIFYPDEKLLWYGRPRQGIAFYKMLVIQMIGKTFVSILLVGLIFYAYFFSGFHGVVFLLAVLIVNIALVIAHPFLEARARAHAYYAVTNRRIIIFRADKAGGSLDTVNLHEIKHLRYIDWRDGVGTIYINCLRRYAPHWYGPRYLFDNGRELDLISDMKSVYGLIQKAQQNAAPKT